MNHKTVLLSIIFVFTFILVVHLSNSYETTATAKYKILAVEYSEGCQRMIENHMNNTCGNASQIIKSDTSNQKISGYFYSKDGIIQRTNPQVKNHFMFYDYSNKTIVCVFCSLAGISGPDMIQTIFIDPSSFTYINKTETINNTNSFTTFSNRYVSPDCIDSTIEYSDMMLNDTISYMLSNCTKTFIHTNQTQTIKPIQFNFNNPFSSLHLKSYLEEIMKGHNFFNGNHTQGGLGPSNCITHKCKFLDPYKKPGW